MAKTRLSRHDAASIGAHARAERLSPARRKAIARKAAKARWKKTTAEERSELQRRRVLARWARAQKK